MHLTLNGESKTMLAGARLELLSGKPYTLVVSKPEYKPFQQQIQLSAQEQINLLIHLEKDIPPFGELVVASTPPGAALYLDEKDSGLKTPATLRELPADKSYKIGLFLPGYDFVTREVGVQAGKVVRVDQFLTPTPPVVSVTSDPHGAEVFVNGMSRGVTPLTLNDLLPEQSHLIRLILPNYAPVEQGVGFAAGDHKTLHYVLQPIVISNENHKLPPLPQGSTP